MPRSMLIIGLFTCCISILGSGPASAAIIINEIMYNSDGTPDVEWIELYNDADAAVDLTGWYLLDSDPTHPRCYLEGSLGAHEYLVVPGDQTLFAVQYPGVTAVNSNAFNPGGVGWGLGNGGDEVNLYDSINIPRDTVAYGDALPWPEAADGSGPSLELLNPGFDNSLATSWSASLVDWGTPAAQNSAYTDNQPPLIEYVQRVPDFPGSATTVSITALVHDIEGLASVDLLVDTDSGFNSQPMYDDGAHDDGIAGDSIFGAYIAPQSDGVLVKYYVLAEDDLGQTRIMPSGAPIVYYAYTVGFERPDNLVVSEVLASNMTGITDEMGQYDDWVEIHNNGSSDHDLTGMFLTDDFDEPQKWPLPPVTLTAGGYLLIWADTETAQGLYHANFKLSATGESIGLFTGVDHGNALVSGFKFGVQNPDVSCGYYFAGGSGDGQFLPEYLSIPTPGADNETSPLFSPVVINEFLTTSAGGGIDDWLELYNRSAEPIDLTGWCVTDARSDPARYVLPGGLVLAPGGFLLLQETDLGFSFSSAGETIMITSSNGLVGQDYIAFGQQSADVSYGRYGDGDSNWMAFTETTPGQSNGMTAVPETFSPLPSPIMGAECYPNPFNPSTTIRFGIPVAGNVKVGIYGLGGRLLRTLAADNLQAGLHTMVWNGRDNAGQQMASGTYFARIRVGNIAATLKLMMVK